MEQRQEKQPTTEYNLVNDDRQKLALPARSELEAVIRRQLIMDILRKSIVRRVRK